MAEHPVTAPRRHLATLAVALCVLGACGDDGDDGRAQRPEAVKGGELTVGIESAVTIIEPGAVLTPGATTIALGVFDPLTTYVHGEVVPFLAQSLEASDDLSTYEIELRPGVTFHDGTPLDADAVVKHFDRLKDPATACSCQRQVSIIDSMEMPDGPTGLAVTFHLAEPSVGLPDLFAGTSGFIESPTAVAALGADFNHRPVGTGPFSLTELTAARAVLTANRDYWREDDRGVPLPYLDTLTVVPIADGAQRVAALQAGDIDVFQTVDPGTIVQAEEAGFRTRRLTGAGTTSLLLNNGRAPFNDVRARQALAHAIDREMLDDRLYSGVRTPSYSPLAPDSPYLDARAGSPRFDPERAAELVEALGGLRFTITCTPTPEAEGIVQLVQQMGERVGMEITLETQDQVAHDARISSRSGDYQAACLRTGPIVEPDALRPLLTTGDPRNLTFFSNLEADQLLAGAAATNDAEDRRAAYRRVQEILAEEVPSLTTVYDLFGYVYDDRRVGPLPAGEANALGALKPAWLSAPR